MMEFVFSDGEMYAVIEHLKNEIAAEIAGENADYVLSVSETDLVDHYVSKYRLAVPQLDHGGIYVHSQGDVDVDVSGEPGRYFSGGGPTISAAPRLRSGCRSRAIDASSASARISSPTARHAPWFRAATST